MPKELIFIAIFILLSLGLMLWGSIAYLFKPKCKECIMGRLDLKSQWYGNKQYECDFCGHECWELDE